MRRKWITKVAAVCLSAAMTATPAVQSFAAEEADKRPEEQQEMSELYEVTTYEAENIPETCPVGTSEEVTSENTEDTTESEIFIPDSSEELVTEETVSEPEVSTEELYTVEETEEEKSIDEISESEEIIQEETEEETEILAEAITYNGFKCRISYNKIIITGYVGSSSTVIIPEKINGYKVVEIGARAFEGNNVIQNITFPKTLTTISEFAFYNCTSLKEIVIPASVRNVEMGAFMGCTGITSFETCGRTVLGEGSVESCSSLTQITLSEETTIGAWAFADNNSLTDVVLPCGVPYAAFGNCKNLTNVVIKNGGVAVYAFWNCLKLSSIKLEGEHELITSFSFQNCISLVEFVCPDTLKYCNLEAFVDCTNLERVYIPAGVPKVEKNTYVWNGKTVFYVEENSVAEKFMKQNGLPYVIMKTGLVNVGNNVWQYQIKGVTQWNYTGLVEYQNSWYYVQNGIVNWNYTGLCLYNGTWYYVEKGSLKWEYTGLCQYYGTWYYVQNGALNWKYSGLVYNGSVVKTKI